MCMVLDLVGDIDCMNVQTPNKPSSNAPAEKRLRREDWIHAAWEILGGGSLNEIKINVLAKQLGVTRGSFYWHFQSRQELIDALVDRWFAFLGLKEVIEKELTSIEDAKDQLWTTFRRVITNVDAGQSVALRLHAKKDLKLRRRIREEDRLRLDHFAERFRKLGLEDQHANDHARIYHAVVMSEYLRNGELPRNQRLAAAVQMHKTLISL